MYVGGTGKRRDNYGRRQTGRNAPARRTDADPHHRVLKGMEALTTMFEHQMGEMSSRMAEMERKNDEFMRQNNETVEYIRKREEAEMKWKSIADERLQRFTKAMNEVTDLMNSKKELLQMNDRLKKANFDIKKRMKILVDENEEFEKKIQLLLSENKELREEIFQVAEALGGDGAVLSLVAEDCGFESDGEWDEKKIKDKQMIRNSAIQTIVMCYVKDKMKRKE